MAQKTLSPSAGGWAICVLVLAGSVVLLGGAAMAQTHKPPDPYPDEFLIGRRTFFDFGPPFNYYELLSAKGRADGGTSIERVILTPSTNVCTRPPTVEVATTSVRASAAELLGGKNPCTIPEKALRRELKRCKKCLVFSGADVVMQVRCGDQSRRIRMDILDQDLFDPHAGTPEHTSWTLGVLARLDQTLGDTVMDRPAFALATSPPQPAVDMRPSSLLESLAAGQLDGLFEGGPDKPSELFRQAQNPPPPPTVVLVDSAPFRPTSYALPKYPPLALATHTGGPVVFTTKVTPDGHASAPVFSSGHPLLREAVSASVAAWTFPLEAASQNIQATLDFEMSCGSPHR